MRLRARLAAATLAVALPQIALLGAWDLHERRVAAEDVLAGLLSSRLTEAERGLCLADPVAYSHKMPRPDGPPPGEPEGAPPRPGRAGKPPEQRAYSSAGLPARAEESSLPEALLARLSVGEITRVDTPWYSSDVRVAAATGWPDPCAVLTLEGSTVAGWLGAVLPASPLWIAPLLGCMLGVLLAAGPVVERIRRLTRAIHESPEPGRRSPLPVDGEDEVAELARAFEAAEEALRRQVEETRRSEQALRTWLADTSHDLNLPITVLRGHLSALREQQERGQPDPDRLRSAIDEAHYIGALVEDLSVVARLQVVERALERHPVDLLALVERVAARHRAYGRERGVAVVHALPGCEASTLADLTLLEQALNNLAYNALRYNRPGGHVAIVLDLNQDRFTVRVIDDGPGVPDAMLPLLGQRGYRGDEARQRAPEGRGLGLNIVRRVADAHGFTLRLKRAEEGGLEAQLSGSILK